MAVFTTLFTARDSELTSFFPGWRKPLASPRKESRKNPLNGNVIGVTTWDPGTAQSEDQAVSLFDSRDRRILAPAVLPDGDSRDYQQSLEENCPVLLRTVPHVAMKGITHFELQELGAIVIGDVVPPARFAECRGDEGCIGALQAQAIPLLAIATDKNLNKFAVAWCERLEEGEVSDVRWALDRLVALARDAQVRDANVFSYTSV